MKTYFVTPQREGNRSKRYSYVDLGLDKNGNPIHIPCPHIFTFLEVLEDNNKPKLIPSQDMHGWIIMLSGQISCPPDVADNIRVVARGEKEIIGITTQVLLLSAKLENFFLRVKRLNRRPAHIIRFFEYNTTIVPYGEADLYELDLHNSTEYCNGGLIKL
jgi:hypothetical protein